MNVKSKFEADSNEVKEPKKRFIWLGYGNPNQLSGSSRGSLMGGIWDTKTFDLILEKIGIKRKIRRRSEGQE